MDEAEAIKFTFLINTVASARCQRVLKHSAVLTAFQNAREAVKTAEVFLDSLFHRAKATVLMRCQNY